MLRYVLFLTYAFAVSAHSSANNTAPSAQDGLTALQFQQIVAANYLQAILLFQKAQTQTMAASYFLQEAQAKSPQGKNNPQMFGIWLEEDEDVDLEEEAGEKFIEPRTYRLIAAYYLMHSNQVSLYDIIINAPRVQQGYYLTRAAQLAASSTNLQPAVAQALYLHSFNTQLKTLKFSYGIQYYSHLRTWLEDEIDRERNLLSDKQFAFQSFYALALVDYQTFLLDLYTQQLFSQLGTTGTSFLEEESSVESNNQFFPFALGMLGAGAGGLNTYSFYLTFYHRTLQLSAAQAGYSHVQFETQVQEGRYHEDTRSIAAYADQSFTHWAAGLLQMSQVSYILAIFNMYQLFGLFQHPTA